MTWKTRTLIVILTLTMLLPAVGASTAFAQEPTRPEVLRGEVTAVSDEGFTLKTRSGQEVGMVVTSDTRYRIPGAESPSLADVQVGMLALVRGTWSEDEIFVAQGVGAGNREQIRRWVIRRHTIRGEVTAVDLDSGTLTVDTQRGEWTVHTTDDTRYRIPDVEGPTLADVQVGDRITVAGRPDEEGDNAGTARIVAVLPKLVKGHGQVISVEGNTLTVDTQCGTYTIVTDEATRYRARHIADPSLDDIQVNDVIFVIGVEQDDGTILAKGIGILEPACL
jgi:hypothetical protein